MDDKEAITIAKDYVSDRLADEQVTNVGLEEVEFSPGENAWDITVGGTVNLAAGLSGRPSPGSRAE